MPKSQPILTRIQTQMSENSSSNSSNASFSKKKWNIDELDE